MPIYEYQSESPTTREKSCIGCRKPFELRRSIERASDLKCPLCKNPIKKLVSRVSTPQVSNYTDNKAKNAGFTVLENLGDGIIEKK